MLNLAMILDEQARKRPEREAVVGSGLRLSYGQIQQAASRVAAGLEKLGLAPGDKIALGCPNLPWFPIVYYGILKLGGVVVPLNVLLKPREIAYHLKNSDARAYFCFAGTPELPMGEMGHEGFQESTDCDHFILLTTDSGGALPAGAITFDTLTADQPDDFPTADRGAVDTAAILYTSGTSGQPKGAELTHSNLLTNAIASCDLIPLDVRAAGITHLVALPLFHSFGQTCQMNSGFYQGGRLVLMPSFDPADALDLIQSEQINVFAGVPTMYWALLNHVREQNLDTAAVARHLAICISGGAAMPEELLRDFESLLGVTILEGYGLSETSPVATFNDVALERKIGSIGQPIAGVELRVVDADDNDVPVDTPGEIVIRGMNVMKGYYNDPAATAQAMRGGWFHTGDVARRDAQGYFFIVDRKKDMIIRGGYNVYPREVEEVMMTHPAVSLVAVIGVPHATLGEEVKAFVIRTGSESIAEDDLIAWCKANMAAYKYPRTIEFRDKLPTGATGKILKRELRAEGK